MARIAQKTDGSVRMQVAVSKQMDTRHVFFCKKDDIGKQFDLTGYRMVKTVEIPSIVAKVWPSERNNSGFVDFWISGKDARTNCVRPSPDNGAEYKAHAQEMEVIWMLLVKTGAEMMKRMGNETMGTSDFPSAYTVSVLGKAGIEAKTLYPIDEFIGAVKKAIDTGIARLEEMAGKR